MKVIDFVSDVEILDDGTMVLSKKLYNINKAKKMFEDEAGVDIDIKKISNGYMRFGFDNPGEIEDGAFFLVSENERITNFHHPVWVCELS